MHVMTLLLSDRTIKQREKNHENKNQKFYFGCPGNNFGLYHGPWWSPNVV